MSIPDWMIDTPSTSADDLSALVARLAQALRKAAPDNDLADKAMDYLARHGVAPSPLRDAHPAKAEVQPNPWQQAVDVELVSAHLGMAGNVSFADAAQAPAAVAVPDEVPESVIDAVADAPPHPVALHPQLLGRLGHGQFFAQ